METVNVHEAKTRLSQLLAQVEAGKEIIIARSGKPIAKLSAIDRPIGRSFGQYRGQFTVPEDFDEPLPNEILQHFLP